MDDRDLEARLRQVERRLRLVILSWGVSLIGTILFGVLVGHAVSQSQVLQVNSIQARYIRARSLEIDDAANHARILLGASTGNPTVQMGKLDEETGPLILLTVNARSASVSASSDMSPTLLSTAHADLTAQVAYPSATSPADVPALPALPFAEVTVNGPVVRSVNRSSLASAFLTADSAGRVKLNLTDAQGFGATLGNIQLTTPSTGAAVLRSAASLTLMDAQGKVLWSAP